MQEKLDELINKQVIVICDDWTKYGILSKSGDWYFVPIDTYMTVRFSFKDVLGIRANVIRMKD